MFGRFAAEAMEMVMRRKRAAEVEGEHNLCISSDLQLRGIRNLQLLFFLRVMNRRQSFHWGFGSEVHKRWSASTSSAVGSAYAVDMRMSSEYSPKKLS